MIREGSSHTPNQLQLIVAAVCQSFVRYRIFRYASSQELYLPDPHNYLHLTIGGVR